MPHITIEYADNNVSDNQVDSLLDALHRSLVATNIFSESHIRLRTLAYRHYRVGGEKQAFIHVTCRIHTGRDMATKQRLTAAVLETLKADAWPSASQTVEVVEMERDSYAKYVAP